VESEVEDWEYTHLEIIGSGFPKFVWVTFDKATTLDQVIGYLQYSPTFDRWNVQFVKLTQEEDAGQCGA